ncbi:MAG: DUF1329 domain-containing protein [Nevskia sp.]
MTRTRSHSICAIVAGMVMAVATPAVPAQAPEASPLGRMLTPLGAEKAGNAAGTIPPWDGSVAAPPPGFKAGVLYPDPYASDSPLFTITAAEVETYKDHLTPGQVAMFRRYPDYKLVVYRTRRSAAYPKAYYDETLGNPARAKLPEGGNGVTGTSGGLPFPMPKDGNEAIWNELTRYRGETFLSDNQQLAVTRSGDYTPVRFEYAHDYEFACLDKKPSERKENLLAYVRQKITAPARLAGSVLLVHEPLDQSRVPRSAWTYNPGQRRMRQAPNLAYDNPGTASDGLRTSDDLGLFNGATDRYAWDLVGKREIYVPYNSYRISAGVPLKDLIRPGHLNQDLARYELHRVWVVEARLKPGTSHLYARRTFYLDEDSWLPLSVDKYDGRGELYRVAEMHSIELYDVPMPFGTVEVHYDLPSGRYLALGIRSGDDRLYAVTRLTAADFRPASLRDEPVR